MGRSTKMVFETLMVTLFVYVYRIGFLHANYVSVSLRIGCKDRLPETRCIYLKNHSVCQTHPDRMERYCPKTCRFCEPTCKDQDENCDLMAKGSYCFRHSFMMKRDCPYSCGFCEIKNPCKDYPCTVDERCYLTENNKPYCKCHIPHCYDSKNIRNTPLCTTSGEDFPNLCTMLLERCRRKKMMFVEKYLPCKPIKKDCRDSEQESKFGLCKKWKSYGFCTKVKTTMERFCNKTCGYCEEEFAAARASYPPKQCISKGFGCCWNDRLKAAEGPRGEGCEACNDLNFCDRFQMNCGDDQNKRFMKKFCPKCCGYCVPTPCEDKNDYCPHWREAGQCERNPDYMNLFCRKTCGVC